MYNFDKKYYLADNIINEEVKLAEIAEKLRRGGKVIGVCTGSFDLLHPGHITHLESAKKFCDVLFVGVANYEYSILKNKLTGRPIFPAYVRAYMASRIKCVDFVFFEDGTPRLPIEILKPNVFIKGPDYSDLKDSGIIKHKKMVESVGGKILFTSDEKISTSDLIRYIKEEIK